LKELLKAKEISEDAERGAGDTIQKLTDSVMKQVDTILAQKEAALMEV
jgi:ribosome recycling factor